MLPVDAHYWEASLDPDSREPYFLDCTNFLNTGENVASFSVSLPQRSLDFGLTLGSAEYIAYEQDNIITIWLSAGAYHAAFEDSGINLPVNFTFITDATPPRTENVTCVVNVRNK